MTSAIFATKRTSLHVGTQFCFGFSCQRFASAIYFGPILMQIYAKHSSNPYWREKEMA